ncbi:MAG TPA: LysR substrate-binding domain-containing protein [Candidatus Angelobacter sp.]|nr:LysR substrate-binding domain-containing protein [Candidatus Angelobacter sp.]
MARPSFSLEQVRSFVAVADHEHISRAAASLFLTQGAVTQQVRHFERAVGLQLLERDGRGVRLTDAGKTMAAACRATLRSVQVLEDTAESIKTLEAGSLHVGASPTCASYYLPSRLTGFTQQHPGVRLSMIVEPSAEINRQVIAGELDCGMIEGEPNPQLLAVVLAHDELILVAHRDHPLAALRRVTAADLARHRYLGRGPAWSAEQQNVRDMIGEALDRSEALNLGHPEYARAAVLAGLGYAALPRLAVAADLKSGAMKRLPGASSHRAIQAIRRPAPGGPALEHFWTLLTAEI